MTRRFRPGDRVRIVDLGLTGHMRTPAYVRGHAGIVERDCGDHLNPESLAYGGDGRPARALYRVRIPQTALWPRYRPSDFRKGVEHGLAPDWPITYEDLAPYYDRVDRIVGVSGLAGNPAMPPHEGYPTPPLPLRPVGRRLAQAFDRLGWHWWPLPAGVVSEDYDGRPAWVIGQVQLLAQPGQQLPGQKVNIGRVAAIVALAHLLIREAADHDGNKRRQLPFSQQIVQYNGRGYQIDIEPAVQYKQVTIGVPFC